MPSTKDPDSPFVEWLLEELAQREWDMAKLAAKMGVDQSVVSGIVNRTRAVGPDSAKRLAAALGTSQIRMFILAGLIDEELADEDAYVLEFRRLVEGMDKETRERVLRVVSALADDVAPGVGTKAPDRPRRRTAAANA